MKLMQRLFDQLNRLLQRHMSLGAMHRPQSSLEL